MAFAPGTWPGPFRNLIRVSNKYVLNPVMLRLAGRRHWYASVLRHVGRRSGERYATPVVADRVDNWFIVPLPYGTQVDWLRNVLTAGRAVIVSGGKTYDVVSPEIIDAAEALPLLPHRRRRTFERTGIGQFMRVTIALPPKIN